MQKWYLFLISVLDCYKIRFCSVILNKNTESEAERENNTYSYIIKGLLYWYWWILSLVGISKQARKVSSFDIRTRDNIHEYQCNNPTLLNAARVNWFYCERKFWIYVKELKLCFLKYQDVFYLRLDQRGYSGMLKFWVCPPSIFLTMKSWFTFHKVVGGGQPLQTTQCLHISTVFHWVMMESHMEVLSMLLCWTVGVKIFSITVTATLSFF